MGFTPLLAAMVAPVARRPCGVVTGAPTSSTSPALLHNLRSTVPGFQRDCGTSWVSVPVRPSLPGNAGRRELFALIARSFQVAMIGEDDHFATPTMEFSDTRDGRLVQQFASMPQGSLIAKCEGRTVRAVGRVLKDVHEPVETTHAAGFHDLDGWCVPIAKRVAWSAPSDSSLLQFGAMRRKFCMLGPENTRALEQIAESIPDPHLPPLPVGWRALQLDDLAPDGLVAEFTEVRRYLEDVAFATSEHEAVAHVIVPLMRSLGVDASRIELERPCVPGRADVVIHSSGDRNRRSPLIVIEAKKPCAPGFRARAQALNYVERIRTQLGSDADELRWAATSDGACWMIWHIVDGCAPLAVEPAAYLNLRQPSEEHPMLGLLNPDHGSDLRVAGASAALDILGQVARG